MINPAAQHFMAQRMGAKIRSEKVDYTPLGDRARARHRSDPRGGGELDEVTES
jgi:hypothetical protein